MSLAIAVGLGAALLLLAAGYLFGIAAGRSARDALRASNAALLQDAARLKQGGRGHGDDDKLREAIRNVLTPLVQREQLTAELSQLGGNMQHRDLTALLDQLVAKGNFFAALLVDEQGFPVASSSALRDGERLGATASLLRLLADRIKRDGAAAPLSLMVHDAANVTTMSRLFTVGSQRLSLTVVTAGRQLTPSALDPALVRLNAMLLGRDPQSAEATREPVRE